MKQFITVDGNTYIADVIKVNGNGTKKHEGKSLMVHPRCIDYLIDVLCIRQEACMKSLQWAMQNNRICDSFEMHPFLDGKVLTKQAFHWVDGSGYHSHFSINAYEAMSSAIEKLTRVKNMTLTPTDFHDIKLNVYELEQLVKATDCSIHAPLENSGILKFLVEELVMAAVQLGREQAKHHEAPAS